VHKTNTQVDPRGSIDTDFPVLWNWTKNMYVLASHL